MAIASIRNAALLSLALLLAAAGLVVEAQAQGTGQVIISGVPPVLSSPFVDDIRQNYEQGQYTMQFTFTGQGATQFQFRITLSKDGQRLVEATSRTTTYQPGTYIYRTFTEPPRISFDVSFSDVIDQLPSRIRGSVYQGGTLPEGTYTLTVEPLPVNAPTVTGVPGMTSFQILYPNPPSLATPIDDGMVTQPTSTFTWTPLMNVPTTAQSRYEIVLVEMLPNQTPLQAIQSNRAHYENVFRNQTSFTYTPDLLPLEPGRRYAWRVGAAASLDGQELPFSGEGRSDIYTFTYQPPISYGAPQLVAPANGDTVDTGDVMLEWTAPSGPSVSENNNYTRIEQRLLVKERPSGQSAAEVMEQPGALLDTTIAYQPGTRYNLSLASDTSSSARVWQVELVGETPDGAVETLAESTVGTYAVGTSTPPALAAACTMALPDDQTPASRNADGFEEQTISVGGFSLRVVSASGSAGELSGTGSIDVPYVDAPLAVTFSDVAVNADGEVYAGTVTAVQDEAASGLQAGLLDGDATPIDELAGTHAADIAAAIVSGKRMASQLTGSDPEGLPYGIAPSGANPSITLAVVGAQFAPTGSRVKTLLQVPMPGFNEMLSLGADDVCLGAGGISGEFALRLLQDYVFTTAGGKVTHRYKAAASSQTGATPVGGTYAKWANDTLGDLAVAFTTEYSRDWLIPQDDQGQDAGGKTGASFSFTVSADDGLGDFIAEGTLERSSLAAAPGFTVADTTVYYDHSTTSNPQGMSFPEGYQGLTSGVWTGLYVPGFSLELPSVLRTLDSPDSRLRASVAGMVIDAQGISMTHSMQDIIAAGTGDLGGWGYSIDSLDVSIQSNSLTEGRLVGGARLPLFNEDIPYEATFTPSISEADLDYTFLLDPREEAYDSGLWNAGITLKEGTNISIDVVGGEFSAAAILHGDLDLVHGAPNGLVKYSGQSLNLPPITFEGLTIRSKGPDYVDPGTWAHASTRANLGGFPIRVDGINVSSIEDGNDLQLGLAFTEVNLVLPGIGQTKKATSADDAFGKETTQVFTASTSFTLWSKIATPDGGQVPEASFDRLQLDQVTVKGGIEKAFSINGQIIFFNPESQGTLGEYGEGIAGKLQVTVISVFEARAQIMFGNKVMPNDDKATDYWMFSLGVSLPTGVALGSSGIGLYGLKGGGYRHMAPPDEWTEEGMNYNPKPVEQEEGQVSPEFSSQDVGTNFTVDPDVSFGFRAGVVLGTMPTPNILSGDVNLDMSFTSSGGLNQIMIAGSAYAMHAGKIGDPTTRASTAQVVIDEFSLVGNPPEETFVGTFAATFEPGDEVGGMSVVKATGEAKLYINNKEDKHFFQIGNPAGDRVHLRYLGGLINAKAYLYMGSDAPSQVAPPVDYCNAYQAASGGVASPLCQTTYGPQPPPVEFGFLFGASLQASFGGRYSIFYATIGAAAGFDLALTKVGQAVCTSTGEAPGANGFYATGQLYAGLHGDVGVIVDLAIYQGRFSILDVGVAAELSGGLPNPFWARGSIAGSYRVLNGLVEGNFEYQFSTGEVCELSGSRVLAGIDAIQDVAPNDTEVGVNVFAEPSATFSLNLDEVHTMEGPEGNEVNVRLSTDGITLYEGDSVNGRVVPGTVKREENGSLLLFDPSEALKGNTTYTFSVNAYAEEQTASGNWVGSTDEDGNPVPHAERTATFTTGQRPRTIQENHVTHTAPLDRKRYYIPGTNSKNGLYLTGSANYGYLEDITDAERDDGETRSVHVRVRYSTLDGTSSTSSPRLTFEDGKVEWDQPSLKPSTTYVVQLVRVRSLNISLNEMLTRLAENLEAEESQRSLDVGGGNTATVRERRIKGTHSNFPGEKVVYSFHFRTSQYSTYAEKIDDVRVSDVTLQPHSQDYHLTVRSRNEPFDQYDLFGTGNVDPRVTFTAGRPEWSSSNTTGTYLREYVRPYVHAPLSALKQNFANAKNYLGRSINPSLATHRRAYDGRTLLALSENRSGMPPPLQREELMTGGYQSQYDGWNYRTVDLRWSLPKLAVKEHNYIKDVINKNIQERKRAMQSYAQSPYNRGVYGARGAPSMQTVASYPDEAYVPLKLKGTYNEPISYRKGGGDFVRINAGTARRWMYMYFR